jgi:thioesterase domain-containing protein
MIVKLRDGDEPAPLFLFPGAGADARELSALASSMRNSRPMLGVELLTSGSRDVMPLTVASIANTCSREICAVQPQGPYFLVGYSFGGLVAIEVARLLRNSGQEVGLLALVDTTYDDRYWTMSQFIISLVRRSYWHVRRIRTLPLREAIGEISVRLRRLGLRAHRRSQRFAQSEPWLSTGSADNAQERCLDAMKCYIPAYYPGAIVVFRAEDEDFGCDPAQLWCKFADTIESRTIPGSHIDIVRSGNSVSRLAAELDARLHGVEA